MRVFLAVGHSPNQALPASRIWHINLCLPLRDLGHEVIEFDYHLEPMCAHADWRDPMQAEFSKKARPRLEAALLEQVRRAHSERPIDLFLSLPHARGDRGLADRVQQRAPGQLAGLQDAG